MKAPWTPSISAPGAPAAAELARLVEVIAELREHCPWTAALTHESLAGYVLEEAHELIEAIEGADAGTGGAELANELGDLLLQVVLHARLGAESGSFDLASVAHGVSAKLVRRSPHVFHPDGTLRTEFSATVAQIEASWEQVKAQERAASTSRPAHGSRATAAPQGPFAGIPATLPALAAAQKTLERARRAGLELPGATGERTGESTAERLHPDRFEDEEQLGQLLLEVVQAAQLQGLDAERALRQVVRGIQGRG